MNFDDSRDRTAGLVIFGIIEILIGALVALFIPLVVVVTLVAETVHGAGTDPDLKTLLASLLMYGVIAAVFISIGIGSIRARKWARAVMLSLSWLWLITGAVSMVVLWFVMPRLWDMVGLSGMADDSLRLVVLTTNLFFGFIYVLLPLAFVSFYRSEHVAATCRARDPRPSWVDDCPQGLVNLVMVYGLIAVSILMMPAYNFMFPCFGTILHGWLGAVAWLVVLLLLVYLIRATLWRQSRSWDLAMGLSLVIAVSSMVTAAVVPYAAWIGRMALPAEQGEMVLTLWNPGTVTMVILTFVFWATWLGYLVYVRRFFLERTT